MSGEQTATNQRTAHAARLERLRALLAEDREWRRADLAAELGVSDAALRGYLLAAGEVGDLRRRSRLLRQRRLRELLEAPEGEGLTVEELAGRLGVDPATISYDLRALGVPDRRSAPLSAPERRVRIQAMLAREPELKPHALAPLLGVAQSTVYRDFRALGLLPEDDEAVPA